MDHYQCVNRVPNKSKDWIAFKEEKRRKYFGFSWNSFLSPPSLFLLRIAAVPFSLVLFFLWVITFLFLIFSLPLYLFTYSLIYLFTEKICWYKRILKNIRENKKTYIDISLRYFSWYFRVFVLKFIKELFILIQLIQT